MTKDQWKGISQSEILVAIVQIAAENAELRSQLVRILKMEPAKRKELLEELVADLKSKDAPRGVVKAISTLLEDSMARQTLGILEPDKA